MIIGENISLKPYNTFQIDVNARYFIEIQSEEELKELFSEEIFKRQKRLILGGGANMLFTEDFDGLVIKVDAPCRDRSCTCPSENHIIYPGKNEHSYPGKNEHSYPGKNEHPYLRSNDNDHIHISVPAGEDWSDFVQYANSQGWAGLQKLAGIPGQVGTAPVSNIGAYGVEIGDLIERVEGYDLQTGEKRRYSHDECEFGYRTSIFKTSLINQFFITCVCFRLIKLDSSLHSQGQKLQKISDEILQMRSEKLPDLELFPSAGSFFKNPVVSIEKWQELKGKFEELIGFANEKMVKLSAGQLIEMAGLKGYSNGKAGVSNKHALILVNEGGATGNDILDVMKVVQDAVKEKFRVELEPEVVIIKNGGE
ncbi:UDP-N-acetylenolpyruvoylglucosamine reductase [candidate division SR1 bacterium]|nr:UDP-N-acetylenolpyruvoylglucosamine reductase [candidate division SR1 bacterium]